MLASNQLGLCILLLRTVKYSCQATHLVISWLEQRLIPIFGKSVQIAFDRLEKPLLTSSCLSKLGLFHHKLSNWQGSFCSQSRQAVFYNCCFIWQHTLV